MPRPRMLSSLPAVTEPNSFELQFLPEVIDVPVGTFCGAKVMSEAGFYAPWPQCAADVNIKSRLEPQVAESPDWDYGVRR